MYTYVLTRAGLDRVSDKHISMAMFGLRNMGDHEVTGATPIASSPELGRVLTYIAELIRGYKGRFEPQRLAACIGGLSSMRGRAYTCMHTYARVEKVGCSLSLY